MSHKAIQIIEEAVHASGSVGLIRWTDAAEEAIRKAFARPSDRPSREEISIYIFEMIN